MRTPIAILASSFLLAACVSGTGTYVPSSVPPAQPVVVELPPVGVTIVQADDERLQVSTNRPAYLAVFEVVPQRGVSLVYPTSASQRRRAMPGSSWLNVEWRAERMGANRYARNDRDDRIERARRGLSDEQATHYVYVIASERPLRHLDRFLDDDDIRDVLGARLFRATDPWETMAELSKRFVPAGQDADWGEDVYEMDAARPQVNVRVARVYCPDGSVVYVRDDYIDRAWCVYRGGEHRVGMPPVPRPDSVVASNGHSILHRNDPRPQPPRVAVFRVQKPADVGGMGQPTDRDRLGGDVRHVGGDDGVVLQGDAKGHAGDDHGNNGQNGNNGQKGNNGNHYGWENGKGNNGTAGNNGRNNGNNGNAGNNGNHGNPGADTVMHAVDKPDVGQGNQSKWKFGLPKADRPAAQPDDHGKKAEEQGKKAEDQGKKAENQGRKADASTDAPVEKRPENIRKRPVMERDSTDSKAKP